ncbi:hypothetical protein [Deinococcus kurensis]|uniref:hypothetical protein n=1 Tax=Deinococcus kurensis TaxID=2662757 RepID=UPI0012D2BA91|nr:hypothetical protein [Deinococcus kurensis]
MRTFLILVTAAGFVVFDLASQAIAGQPLHVSPQLAGAACLGLGILIGRRKHI